MEQVAKNNATYQALMQRYKANQKNQASKNNENLTTKNDVYCQTCKDKGYIFIGDAVKLCICSKVKHAQEVIEKQGYKNLFKNKTLENFETTKHEKSFEMLKRGIEYIKADDNKSFLALGQSGGGKTHLIIGIANKMMKKGKVVSYFDYVSTLPHIKNLLMTDKLVFENELNRYKQSSILIIEDLFKSIGGNLTEADKRIIYEIIDYRYKNDLPVMITSELTMQDLKRLDVALVGRLLEMAQHNIIELVGDKYNARF